MSAYSTTKYGSINERIEGDEMETTYGEFYDVPIKSPVGPSSQYRSASSVDDASNTNTRKFKEDIVVAVACADSIRSSQCDSKYCILALHNGIKPSNGDRQASKQLSSASKTLLNLFLAALDFSVNPFSTENDGIGNTQTSDLRLAMLSNFSTAYNLVSISLALSIMAGIYDTTPRDKSLCSSALIAGMIIGQLLGGIIGDVLGRHFAMAVVMSLQVVGAIATAFSFESSSNTAQIISVYTVLAFLRFLLGLGCGGVYPLAATLTAESNADLSNKADASKFVALSFSMQGVGYLVAPLAGWALVSILGDDSDLAWRLLLGFGAIPGLFLMSLRLKGQMKMAFQDKRNKILRGSEAAISKAREVPVSVVDAIMMEDELTRKLLGTAGSWFVFDVIFYANVLFQPVVLSAAFGPSETIAKAALDTVVVSSVALPGYFVSVALIGKQSPRFIQAQGFLMMGILHSVIGTFFRGLSDQGVLTIALYGSTFFFSNYGPNATTYLLPSMTFSKSCRATMNGLCAASGKAGALLGAMVFSMAVDRFGQQIVILACAALSFVGVAVTLTCVSERILAEPSKEEQDRETAKNTSLTMKVVWSEPSLIDYCNVTS